MDNVANFLGFLEMETLKKPKIPGQGLFRIPGQSATEKNLRSAEKPVRQKASLDRLCLTVPVQLV